MLHYVYPQEEKLQSSTQASISRLPGQARENNPSAPMKGTLEYSAQGIHIAAGTSQILEVNFFVCNDCRTLVSVAVYVAMKTVPLRFAAFTS